MEDILKLFTLTERDAAMILVCSGLFCMLWKILESLVFQRFFKLTELREEKTIGVVHASEGKLKTAKKLKDEYEDALCECRVSALKKKVGILIEAEKEAAELIESAQHSAEKIILEGKASVGKTFEETKAGLTKEIDKIARSIVGKVTTIQ